MAYREYVEKGYMPSREMMKKFLIEQIDFKRNFEVVDLYNAVDKVSAEDVTAKIVLPKLPVRKMAYQILKIGKKARNIFLPILAV